MTKCLNCSAPSPGGYLCPDCRDVLAEALDQLPWLIGELQTTVCRLDRLNLGVQGRGSENPSPINLGGSALATDVGEVLTRWTDRLCQANGITLMPKQTVGPRFIGPLPGPQWRRLLPGYLGSPMQRARWLADNVDLVAKHPRAGDICKDILELTGERGKPSKPGRLVRAIDRVVRVYAGACPTLVARDRDGDITCATDLFAEADAVEVRCPRCHQDIDVAKNRQRSITDGDLMTEAQLIKTMETLREPVYSDLLQRWLKSGDLKPSGYLSGSRIVEHRTKGNDARLLSLSRCRQLRWAHQLEKKAKAS